jgi:capsular exopolysaccharide synthesis family protein
MLTRETLPSNGTTASLLPRPAPQPPGLARPLLLRGLAQALRRQWVLGVSAGLAVGVVVGCLTFALLPASKFSAYTARARLQVNAAAPVVVGQSAPQVDFDTLKGTIPARIRSRVVLGAVLDRPVITELNRLAGQRDPYEFLQNELVVDWSAGPEVLTIQMSGERPRELADLVNAVADVALRDINNREVRSRAQQLEQLERIHKEYEASLAPKRKKLEELARRVGSEPGEQTLRQVFAALALNTRQTELLRVQSERRHAGALLKGPEGSRPSETAPPKPPLTKLAFEEVMKTDPELRPVMTQIGELNSAIARYTALYKDNPAKAKQVIEEKGLQSQIDSLYALGRQQYEKKLQALSGRTAPEPVRAETASTEELKASEEALEKEIARLERELHELESKASVINALKQEIQVREDVGKNVATSLETMRLEMSAPPRAVWLEEAAVPTVREERRLWFAGLAGLGGAVLALLGVALLEFQRRKLYSSSDVSRSLEVPVVGTQPRLPAALNPLDPAHAKAGGSVPWYNLPNDGLDATRALLMQTVPPSAPRVVTVAAAVGGEGSSVLAVQLAASLARAGRRTLLIDANLRRPALHRAFRLEAVPGLAEVLRGEAAMTAAVRPAPPERLWMLPAGNGDLCSLQALSREAVSTLLDHLKRDYEYVIVDTAPVLACADGLLLAQRSDAVLVSVLGGVSTLPSVHAAWQRLSALGVHLLGIVVQAASDDPSARSRYSFSDPGRARREIGAAGKPS